MSFCPCFTLVFPLNERFSRYAFAYCAPHTRYCDGNRINTGRASDSIIIRLSCGSQYACVHFIANEIKTVA